MKNKNIYRFDFRAINFLHSGENTVQNYIAFRRNKKLYVENLQRVNFYTDLLKDMKRSISVSGNLTLTNV